MEATFLNAPSFAVKKKRNSWNDEEIEKIMAVIENEDVDDFLRLDQMRSMKDEETITLEEYKKQIAEWK